MAKNQRDSAEEPRPHEPSLELFPNLTALDVDKLHAKQTASARGEGSALRNEQRVCTPQDTRQEDWCLVTRLLLLPTLATFFGYLLWLPSLAITLATTTTVCLPGFLLSASGAAGICTCLRHMCVGAGRREKEV
jgi:hypothetical protein